MAYSPAYVAGVLDSDGSIFIQKSGRDDGRIRYSLRTSISQYRYDDMFAWLQGEFGGGRSNAPSRRVPEWYVCGAHTVPFLTWVLPELHIKREQAEVAVEFAKTLKVGGNRPYGIMLPVQTPLYERMHGLNRRHKLVASGFRPLSGNEASCVSGVCGA